MVEVCELRATVVDGGEGEVNRSDIDMVGERSGKNGVSRRWLGEGMIGSILASSGPPSCN